jgi:glycosyltransferase involved in cell wall biosynthesis
MPKDKKALFVSYNAATEPLVRSQVLPYISALSQIGIKFYFLSFEKDFSQGADISKQLNDAGIEWIRLKFHSRPLLLAKWFDIKIGSIVVLWACLTKKIKIIHARGIMGACIAMIPAKLAGVKFIFDMKSSLAEAYRLNGRIKRESITYRMLVSLEKLCVLNSDEVIVETRTHKEELEKLFGGRKKVPRITVLPCCVDVQRFEEKKEHAYVQPGGDMRLVYLGSLSGWYMIPEMLDLFKALKTARLNSECLFLTDDKEGLVARIAKDKGLDGVTVTKAAYKDVPKNLWGATAGVLFKCPNERLDSFPIKIAEYLAAGLPIVINAGMGDVEDMIIKNRVGVVVRCLDEGSYARSVKELELLIKEGPALQKRCEALAAENLSSKFGLSIYEAVYKRILR